MSINNAEDNTTIEKIPSHVAIIMDGNGRWASQKGLPRNQGHEAGTKNLRRVIKCFAKYKIKYLTLYAFSTENWLRPETEVNMLFDLLAQSIVEETPKLHSDGVQIRHIGRLDSIPKELGKSIEESIELTKSNQTMILTIAFNYGGRTEIIDAIKNIVKEKIDPDNINEGTFSNYLYDKKLPDPDLIIRTAGEMRISNFLIWQSAYSEYYSSPVLWPDFDDIEIKNALYSYSNRHRKYGTI
ncbi:MAG: isoprenyl transferase [SAR202 cluster bacterium]|nr:isoprenyl transferase [SAR202 cluster bacterium]|tara:strand:+ start:1432 stop:2154 length:723 start_codon:yes stop_codon:yes gene_type:complete